MEVVIQPDKGSIQNYTIYQKLSPHIHVIYKLKDNLTIPIQFRRCSVRVELLVSLNNKASIN